MIARPPRARAAAQLVAPFSRVVRRSRPVLRLVLVQFTWLVFVGLAGLLGVLGSGSLAGLWTVGALAALLFGAWRCAGFQVGLQICTQLAHRAFLHALLIVPAALGVLLGSMVLVGNLGVELWRMFWARWFMGRSRISHLRLHPRLRALWRLSLRRSAARTTVFLERRVDPVLRRTRQWLRRTGRGGHFAVCGVAVENEEAEHHADELRSRWLIAAAAGPALCTRPYAHVLPATVVPRNPKEADTLRALLGADLLTWGSVHADGRLWVHVVRPPVESNADCDLFPTRFQVDLPPILRLDAHDLDQLDLLCRLLEVQVLADRERRRPWALPRAADRLGDALSRDRDHWTRVLFEHLLHQPDDVLNDTVAPTVTRCLVRALSDWVGFELSAAHASLVDERLQRRLVDTIEKCLALEPDRPEHYYRYAALLCLMDDEENARHALEAAATRAEDFPLRVADSDVARVESALRSSRPHYSERRLALARGAVQAARAVHVAGAEAAAPLRAALARERWWEEIEEFRPHAGLAMLHSLTAEPVEECSSN